MKLVIAEKPSVARDIARVIGAGSKKNGYMEGNGYKVSWCFGHLVGLSNPESYGEEYKGRWSFETLPILPEKWKYSVNADTKSQFEILKGLMASDDVDTIICATDAGREGECIFRYVYNIARCKKPVKRLWISSLEDVEIKAGFADLRDSAQYDNLFAAGAARAKADWLIGMNATRLFTCRFGATLNVGRVQTPTLAMVVKRDNDVKNFVKQKFFTVQLDLGEFSVESERIDDESKANGLTSLCNGKTAVISEVIKEQKSTKPPKLYDLTTLQREANRFFGFTAQQTLDYTQSLYEQKKLVTYPRTDSQYITEEKAKVFPELLRKTWKSSIFSGSGIQFNDNIGTKNFTNNSKVSDHHAIITTDEIENYDVSTLPAGELSILKLIAMRMTLAVGEPEKYEAVKIAAECENNAFSASGRTVISAGWKKSEKALKAWLKGAEEAEEKTEQALPDVSKGAEFDNVKAQTAEHFTSPPKPFTEDTLLSAMERAGAENFDEDTEKKGLGTPATRAETIETLVNRGYLERVKKQIKATEKGVNLIEVVPDEVKSPKLTADWENVLQQIEKGEADDKEFLSGIAEYVRELVKKYGSKAENSVFAAKSSPILGCCPNCGKEVKKGKFGFYCTGKCGMNVAMVYGKELTEAQLDKLLNGKEVTYTNNGKKTTVLPRAVPNSYTTKDGKEINGFQWETKSARKS
ncbi:MAG: DNA topoisomerase 3 [Eubacterium sp.]|nr:DNA topoisomerase 3 [Eubacterium sp.]